MAYAVRVTPTLDLERHMSNPGLQDLIDIGYPRGGQCLSVFMPASSARDAGNAGLLELERLLGSGVRALESRGVSKSDAAGIAAAVRQEVERTGVLAERGEGLAVYWCAGRHAGFRTAGRIGPQVTAGPRCIVRPLLESVQAGPYFVLAVSRGGARLLRVAGESASPVEVPGMPSAASDLAQFDESEKHVSSHSSSAPSTRGRGPQTVHGQGGGRDARDATTTTYLRQVHAALVAHVGNERLPLVLAASDEVAAEFRRVATYPGLIAETIPAHDRPGTDSRLVANARRAMETNAATWRRSVTEGFAEQRGQGRTAEGAEEVLKAASDGRVSDLFIARDAEVWGVLDRVSGRIRQLSQTDPESDDLLDLAAAFTLRSGGQAYSVAPAQMPAGTESPVAALVRNV
jgi:hypothetical protein